MNRFKSFIHRLFSTQEGILAVFVAVMLVPDLFLAYTEPYRLSTVLASLLLPGAFYLLWALIARRPGGMILAALPFMILGAFQLVLLYLFGDSIIAVDMFLNVFTTNVSEATELLGNIYPAIIGVCVLYIPLLVLAVRSLLLKQRLNGRFRAKAALIGCVMALGGCVCLVASKAANPEFGVKYHIFPANVIYNIQLTLERWKLSENYPETSKDFRFDATKRSDSAHREVYVLVIGEASRAANWQLFGYGRPTTPDLAGTDGVVPFSDLLTQANATHKSVPIILSPASAENYSDIYKQKSIISLYKEAGFKTLFISNQVPNRSLIDYFAAEADRRIDISPRENDLITENRYDGDALPHLREAIVSTDSNLLVVIHTYGSHFDYTKRYPASFSRFTPDAVSSVRSSRENLVNAYDNSIAYTDHVLSEIISTLDSADVCSALLYCADHGEDLMDDERDRFLHASPIPTYYQLHIAGLGWFSDRYRESYPYRYEKARANRERPVTTASIFHTMAQIGDIESPYIDSTRSLVSNSFRNLPRMYLTDHAKAVEFFNTGLKEEDFRMLDKHRIEYDKENVKKIKY